MEFVENIVGLKCRVAGTGPNPNDAREEDYIYTVVGCWLQEAATPSYGKHELMCAVVAHDHGGTNVLRFLALEFMDVE